MHRFRSLVLTAFTMLATMSHAQLATSSPGPPSEAPATVLLPGHGAAQHPFLYAGEWDTRKPLEQSIFIVRGGNIVWQYSMPLKTVSGGNQEFDDATQLLNGNIIFSRMSGAGIVSPDKKLLWHYDAPPGTEIHSAQPVGKNRVLIMRNGNPAEAMIINTTTGAIETEIPIPTTVHGTHGQFRHIRMTKSGTILVPHLSEGKVVEYDQQGKMVWSVAAKSPWQAIRLKNGNTLIAGDASRYARGGRSQGGYCLGVHSGGRARVQTGQFPDGRPARQRPHHHYLLDSRRQRNVALGRHCSGAGSYEGQADYLGVIFMERSGPRSGDEYPTSR